MRFETLLQIHRKNQPEYKAPAKLLAFDPGETTGWAIFENGSLTRAGQLDTSTIEIGIDNINRMLEEVQPDKLVYEDYRVYGWKADQHSFSQLHTPQLIGVIRTLTRLEAVPYHYELAQQPKQFCTDDKLKAWGYWQPGLKHARDAIRHGCFYLLFTHMKPEK